jgi:hypothetical protein
LPPRSRSDSSAAPRLGKNSSVVTLEVDAPAHARGVLYALAEFSGGVTCYLKDGFLNRDSTLFEVERTNVRSESKLPAGKHTIKVESRLTDKIGGHPYLARRMTVATKWTGPEDLEVKSEIKPR